MAQSRLFHCIFRVIKIFIVATIICLQTITITFGQQKILIKGIISDSKTKEPIPFCNIHLSVARSGTISQNDGIFNLQVPNLPDTIIISTIGYENQKIAIHNSNKNFYEISLNQSNIEIGEVVIVPGENPANVILRKVIQNKSRNNPLRANTIACNTYTKVLANSVAEKDNQFLTKTGVPIFFSEKLTQNYICRKPRYESEKVIEEKLTGLGLFNEFNLFGVTSNATVDFNFYDNILEIFDKPFISPLNNRAFLYYRFYLHDSIMGEFGKEYIIQFIPKNINDLAFSGHMKVIDEIWALSEISTKIPIDANLNYINKLEVFQTFVPIGDSLTYFHVNELVSELKITKDNSLFNIDFSAIVNKRTIYSDVLLNFPPLQPGTENELWDEISPVKKLEIKENYLHKLRPEVLSLREQNALATIDSLNNNWKIKTADAVTRMFITGYIPGKFIDIGPYLELIKHNKVEGYRLTLSGRSNTAITKNTMLYGHLGYGFSDQEWKYGLGLKHKFDAYHRRIVTLQYRNDMSRIGDNRSIFLIKENMMVTGEDNIIASFITTSPIDKLSMEKSFRAEYEHEWRRGFVNMLSWNNREIESGKFLPFVNNGVEIPAIKTNEITLGTRLSWKEAITDDYCRRYYMSTQYPIVNIRVTGGRYKLHNITNNYLITRAVVNHDINIGLTKFEYILEAGATLGNVPFPLLEIHRSDQSLGFALYSFNMMKEMEFASDRFLSLMGSYHLNGLFFNRIPLLKRIGIREVVSAKILWSHLGAQHMNLLDFPAEMKDARIPYSELSVGLENILQYFRVDFVWRLWQPEIQHPLPFAIKARFDFNF